MTHINVKMLKDERGLGRAVMVIESSPHLHRLLVYKINFNIIFPSMPTSTR
jgi:hypothetical protein